jgi:hypothetical protein
VRAQQYFTRAKLYWTPIMRFDFLARPGGSHQLWCIYYEQLPKFHPCLTMPMFPHEIVTFIPSLPESPPAEKAFT